MVASITWCDHIWHVIYCSEVVILMTICYIRFTYFTYLLTYLQQYNVKYTNENNTTQKHQLKVVHQ